MMKITPELPVPIFWTLIYNSCELKNSFCNMQKDTTELIESAANTGSKFFQIMSYVFINKGNVLEKCVKQ